MFFLSMHLLLWINAILDCICIGFAELWGTAREQKIQNKMICLKLDSYQQPSASYRKVTQRIRKLGYRTELLKGKIVVPRDVRNSKGP